MEDRRIRRVQSMPSLAFEAELRKEIEKLKQEMEELREAIAVFGGEHARWLLRYTWRVSFISNVAFGCFLFLSTIYSRLRHKYRISGFIGDLLVPGAFRVRGGLWNTVMEGAMAGLKPAAPFALAAVLLLRRTGWLRMLGVAVSSAYSSWLAVTGKNPWTNVMSILCNVAYLVARSMYRIPLSELRTKLRNVVLSPQF